MALAQEQWVVPRGMQYLLSPGQSRFRQEAKPCDFCWELMQLQVHPRTEHLCFQFHLSQASSADQTFKMLTALLVFAYLWGFSAFRRPKLPLTHRALLTPEAIIAAVYQPGFRLGWGRKSITLQRRPRSRDKSVWTCSRAGPQCPPTAPGAQRSCKRALQK